jgi:hypothetical protein
MELKQFNDIVNQINIENDLTIKKLTEEDINSVDLLIENGSQMLLEGDFINLVKNSNFEDLEGTDIYTKINSYSKNRHYFADFIDIVEEDDIKLSMLDKLKDDLRHNPFVDNNILFDVPREDYDDLNNYYTDNRPLYNKVTAIKSLMNMIKEEQGFSTEEETSQYIADKGYIEMIYSPSLVLEQESLDVQKRLIEYMDKNVDHTMLFYDDNEHTVYSLYSADRDRLVRALEDPNHNYSIIIDDDTLTKSIEIRDGDNNIVDSIDMSFNINTDTAVEYYYNSLGIEDEDYEPTFSEKIEKENKLAEDLNLESQDSSSPTSYIDNKENFTKNMTQNMALFNKVTEQYDQTYEKLNRATTDLKNKLDDNVNRSMQNNQSWKNPMFLLSNPLHVLFPVFLLKDSFMAMSAISKELIRHHIEKNRVINALYSDVIEAREEVTKVFNRANTDYETLSNEMDNFNKYTKEIDTLNQNISIAKENSDMVSVSNFEAKKDQLNEQIKDNLIYMNLDNKAELKNLSELLSGSFRDQNSYSQVMKSFSQLSKQLTNMHIKTGGLGPYSSPLARGIGNLTGIKALEVLEKKDIKKVLLSKDESVNKEYFINDLEYYNKMFKTIYVEYGDDTAKDLKRAFDNSDNHTFLDVIDDFTTNNKEFENITDSSELNKHRDKIVDTILQYADQNFILRDLPINVRQDYSMTKMVNDIIDLDLDGKDSTIYRHANQLRDMALGKDISKYSKIDKDNISKEDEEIRKNKLKINLEEIGR